MHFRTATIAILACAAHVSAVAEAQPKPYRLAVMPITGMSLMRRQTNGYQPEQSQCHEGSTCAEACGAGYTQCPSHDDIAHCYNPDAKQKCCGNGSGDSCDEGYYCTHDHSSQTWCCPNNMDLAACAAAYSVTGGLETASSTTSAATTSTAAPSTTAAPKTTSKPSTTSYEDKTTASESSTNSTSTSISTSIFTSTSSSSSYTTAWYGSNSTDATAGPTQSVPGTISTGPTQSPTPSTISGAATSSFSALLLLAAGVVALL